MTRRSRLASLIGSAAVVLATAGLYAPAAGAEATITPRIAHFGSHQIGATSAPQTFTLTVTCNTAMSCAPDPYEVSIEISGQGPLYSEFHVLGEDCPMGFPGTSAAGESCTITVDFSPLAFGLRGAALNTGAYLATFPPPPADGPTALLNGCGLRPGHTVCGAGAETPGGDSQPPGLVPGVLSAPGEKAKKCKRKKGSKAASAKRKCAKKKKRK